MAILQDNEFSSYLLTEEEELQGSILTVTQRQFLQNQLAIAAAEKLTLEFDTAKPQEFIQQEAYKRGQIDMIKYILDTSEASILAMNTPIDTTNQE